MKFLHLRRQPLRLGTRRSPSPGRGRLQATKLFARTPCSALAAASQAFRSLPSSWKQIAAAHGWHFAEAIAAAPDDEFFRKLADSRALRVAEMNIMFTRLLATGSEHLPKHSSPEIAAMRFFVKAALGHGPADSLLHLESLGEQHSQNREGRPPRKQMHELSETAKRGEDIRAASDAAAAARVAAAIHPSSAGTYASHWRGVLQMCRVLQVQPMNPSGADIRAVLANVNCASTQRGWLAAWRWAFTASGIAFPGDRDGLLGKFLHGSTRLASPRLPKKRITAKLMVRLLRQAAKKECWDWAATTATGYIFLLRMPSEFWKQFNLDILKWHSSAKEWHYGPVRRKGHELLQTIRRKCSCKTNPVLCMCTWQPVLQEKGWVSTQQRWTSLLHTLLRIQGIGPEGFTSHVLRRGGAADLLAQSGFHHMCSVAGWKDARSAFHYTPFAEVEMHACHQVRIDASDSE